MRARTRAELAAELERREFTDEVVTLVLDRLVEVGLLDDAAFAEQWVDSRHRHRGLGRRALSQELRRKGVDTETAGEAVAGLDADAERAKAGELVRRKLPSLDRIESQAAARRLVGMLARKGYGAGMAYEVVRTEMAARGAELDEAEADLEDEEPVAGPRP
jgi:regulatory protein